ncbi:hypothetical protein LCGC14_0232540 [marine sediment metagenome]|uniref:Uncharacterized protein n=1 Tax=marine sediment metagenome TaxID=412755 RepID=A0A0F9XED9_9ZZZZ
MPSRYNVVIPKEDGKLWSETNLGSHQDTHRRAVYLDPVSVLHGNKFWKAQTRTIAEFDDLRAASNFVKVYNDF